MANDQTDKRRQRVRELFGRPDRAIAEILLEEGFTVTPKSKRKPATRAAREKAEATQVDSMRSNVRNDREWCREKWRKRAAAPLKSEDVSVQLEEHIASLESDLEEVYDLINQPATKPTARALLIGERRQTRALLAKARGVDELSKVKGQADAGQEAQTIGVVFGFTAVSSEMQEKIAQQQIEETRKRRKEVE